MTREEISHRVLDRPLLSYDRSLDIHVSNLRRKLGSSQGEDVIKTVRGVGYVYVKSGAKTSPR